MKYSRVGLGGTFDHFHAGHQSFLQQIATQADHLAIGITQPELIRSKAFADQLEPYATRAQAVKDFCKKQNISCELFPLTDMYGPTLTDKSIEAIFVTTETVAGGRAINTKRTELGLPELPLTIIELLPATDGLPISSQRIRKGEISRSGVVYKELFKEKLHLTPSQRQFFSQLHGAVVSQPQSDYAAIFCCVVGDTSFERFMRNNWPYSLGLIDFKKQRKEYQPTANIVSLITTQAENQAGEISPRFVEIFQAEASKILRQATTTSMRGLIKVVGEEDLAAVVAVIVLPLGSTVYYGQPRVGMVEVVVTENIKERFYQVLSNSS